MKTSTQKNIRARILRLQNGKTLKNKLAFARFVLGGMFELSPYDGRQKRSYFTDAETCVAALDSLNA